MAACLWLVAVAPAHASGDVVDQSQAVATGANTLKTPMAQTFTAGANAQIDRVSLAISTIYGAVTTTVQIRGVTAGKPNSTVYGSSSFSGFVNCCRQWHDFAFNPAVSESKGTMYAIVVSEAAGSPALTWYDSYSFDTYPAGQMWLASGSSWIYQSSFGKDFCFQTWVISAGANRPPVVAEASQVVSTTEGTPTTNSGTYSDPDGDTVTLNPTFGSLTKTGTSSGTWTWTAPAADEAPLQTVAINASDGKGGTASVSFTYTVLALPPTVTITGAPASGPEATAITLTGKASSPSPADSAAPFTLSWTVTKNGSPFGSNPTLGSSLSVTPDDEGTFTVALQAIDDGGNSATTAVTFTGTNVPPTAEISVTHATLVLVPLQSVTVTAGFTDPGMLDTHTSSLNYGDGTPAETGSYPAGGSGDLTDTYDYTAPGTYVLTYAVTDDDGGVGTATTTVIVQTPAQALGVIDGYVQAMSSLNGGEKNGLSAKLRAAEASAARGDTNATCNQLDAFMNDLAALTSNGRLSATDSAALSSSAWTVHRALGCTKVKVGWLTLSL